MSAGGQESQSRCGEVTSAEGAPRVQRPPGRRLSLLAGRADPSSPGQKQQPHAEELTTAVRFMPRAKSGSCPTRIASFSP